MPSEYCSVRAMNGGNQSASEVDQNSHIIWTDIIRGYFSVSRILQNLPHYQGKYYQVIFVIIDDKLLHDKAKRVVFENISIVLRNACCAEGVILSASSNIINIRQ